MPTEADIISLSSSIELKDVLVDTKWFRPGETYSVKPTGNKWIKRVKKSEGIELEDYVLSRRPFYARWYQKYKNRALARRIEKFDEDEVKVFVAQKLFKVDGIICDQQTKLLLIKEIVLMPNHAQATDEKIELMRKYGADLVRWVDNVTAELGQPSSKIVQEAMHDFTHLKTVDPLSNWTQQDSDFCARMLERINSFASVMADMVKYSFIIEPGTITPHLSEYVAEFGQLETFFERNLLSPEEAEQSAFNRNYFKARNRLLECADQTRIILSNKKPIDDSPYSYEPAPQKPSYLLHVDDIFGHDESPDHSDEGNDFIHASYVRGGPLLNTFILTQAPLPSTINDFWRMVWQERSKYIIMLCKAVDITRLGLLDSALPNTCPYYWPRYEHEEVRYGDFIVCNHKIDGTIDPLFNVTHLSIRAADEVGGYEHKIEHWQYDWKDFSDFHWPLRILRRARMSPTPTIVHCLDGCGRSGTLVTIEALLMHLLRGSAHYDKLVLTTAVFVRLQRRHAISSPLQYLYIYRTILHWMQPYITSNTVRFILGLIYPNWGFIGKYEKMIACRRRF